jgi:hypothetical protein
MTLAIVGLHLLSATGMTPVCQLLDHIFSENATTGKLGSFFHQFQEFVLALLADDSGIAQVNDELAPLKILSGTAPCAPQFPDPGLNKLSFDDQAAFRSSIDG